MSLQRPLPTNGNIQDLTRIIDLRDWSDCSTVLFPSAVRARRKHRENVIPSKVATSPHGLMETYGGTLVSGVLQEYRGTMISHSTLPSHRCRVRLTRVISVHIGCCRIAVSARRIMTATATSGGFFGVKGLGPLRWCVLILVGAPLRVAIELCLK